MDKTACVIFVIGEGYHSGSVQDELRKRNDILQVNVPDSYSNLVYKVVAAPVELQPYYPGQILCSKWIWTV
ncbi:hypothetical protein COOONC_20959 [Cooperia oncophora]